MQQKYLILVFLLSSMNIRGASSAVKTPQPHNLLKNTLTQNVPICANATTKSLSEAPSKRIVTITSNIKPEMLIKHWMGKREPNSFAILVDGKELAMGKTITTTIENNILDIQYNYSFAMGIYQGKRKVTFEVPEKQHTLSMTFSWENDHRVILDHAKAILKKPIEKVES